MIFKVSLCPQEFILLSCFFSFFCAPEMPYALCMCLMLVFSSVCFPFLCLLPVYVVGTGQVPTPLEGTLVHFYSVCHVAASLEGVSVQPQ